MLNNLIFAKRKSLFEKALNNGEVLDEAIVFIEDTKEIWNHGVYFDCSTFDHSSFESTEEWVNKSKHIKFFDLSASLTSTQVEELNSYLSQSVGSYSSNPIYPVVRFKLNHEDCAFNNGVLLSCRTLNRITGGMVSSGTQNTYYNLTIAYSTESNYFENNSSSSTGGEVVGGVVGGGVVVGPSTGGTTTGSSTSLDDYKNYMMIAEVFITIRERASMTMEGILLSYEYSGVEGVNTYPMYVLTSGEGTKFLSDDGTYKEISTDIVEDISYDGLKNLVDTNSLIPGKKYKITDYSCIYIQPETNIEMEINASDITGIICTALTNNTLSEDVEVLRASGYTKIIECKYDINPEHCLWTNGMTTKSPKGAIWYMKDEWGNECDYDFKHIKFRRWAINDITANMALNDGTTSNPSPYRVNARDNSTNTSNDNAIGAGDPIENTLIPAIFNGTWAGCIDDLKKSTLYSEEDLVQGFHTDYILTHKPYQDTSYPYDKYLACTSNASGKWINKSINNTKDRCIIDINSADYIDRYTFDYNGTDASELLRAEATNNRAPLCMNNKIARSTNAKSVRKLPNTTIIVSNSVISASGTAVADILLSWSLNNTILIKEDKGYESAASCSNFTCDYLFLDNLIIGNNNLSNIHFSHTVNGNYLNVNLSNLHSLDIFNGNVMFGFITDIKVKLFTNNLCFCGFGRIKLADSSSWVGCPWGLYTTEVNLDAADSNIFGPFIRVNSTGSLLKSTFRSTYNNGFTTYGWVAGSSYGTVLGSEIHYSYSGSKLIFGSIDHCVLNTDSLNDGEASIITTNKGISVFSSSAEKVPNLVKVTIEGGNAGPPAALRNIVTDDQTTKHLKWDTNNNKWIKVHLDNTLVEHGTNDTTFTLTPNTLHIWDTVSSLDLSLGEELRDVINEFMFQFNSGETPTTIILPDTIKWVNDFPLIEANKTYQCSIINNIGVICGV